MRSGGYVPRFSYVRLIDANNLIISRHTPFAGSANIQGGVTIDLSKLNQVEVSDDQTQVSIGPGNSWENVYLTLDALGISTSGGRASTVGVGGLTLGGEPFNCLMRSLH